MNNNEAHRENIRKLAEKDKIKGRLESIQDREPIIGSLTTFNDVAFAPDSNAAGGTDGGINPDDPNSFAERTARDPNKDGPQDADDLLDDKAGPVLPNDSAGDPYSGGSLNKITGLTDCNTGQCVTAHLDGRFDAPTGWDGPDSPPALPSYQQGYYWHAASFDTSPYSTPEESSNAAIAAETQPPYNATSTTLTSFVVANTDGNGVPIQYRAYYDADYSGTIFHKNISIDRGVCTNQGPPACPTSPPTQTEWPPDGCYDVAMIDGTLQTNQYDSEAPASAKEERSAAQFCTPNGKTVTVRAAANGGTMIYQVGANMKVYNSDGTLRAAGDATTQNIEANLPR